MICANCGKEVGEGHYTFPIYHDEHKWCYIGSKTECAWGEIRGTKKYIQRTIVGYECKD